jgi:hypothetical protein
MESERRTGASRIIWQLNICEYSDSRSYTWEGIAFYFSSLGIWTYDTCHGSELMGTK